MANELESRAIDVVRGLAMDAPQKANSGHPGTAMALAPLAHVLWTRVMRYDPSAPDWPDRDRFVLSAGHASILLYSMLYLTGYGLTLSDLEEFRQWGSAPPARPASHLLFPMVLPTGYGLALPGLEGFRQWGSRTPGHPERGHTPGVEVT